MITVILVDDHAVVRAGLKAVLGSAKDIEVIGEGIERQGCDLLAQRLDPDVIVMDLSMGEMDGAEATKEIVGKKTRGKVLDPHDARRKMPTWCRCWRQERVAIW